MTNTYCPNCGETLSAENANFCSNCGKSCRGEQYNRNAQSPQSNQIQYQTTQSSTDQHHGYPRQKSPFLALILSFFWTGLGQLYNGKFVKGILLQIAFAAGLVMFIIPGVIVWVIGLWDAYNDSEKMNRGEIPFDEPTFGAILAFIFFWVIAAIVIGCFLAMVSIIPFMMI